MIYDRCLVTMIYYGTASANEAKRHGSEVKRDAVMVMQQHCGGENLIVFKGALLPQGNRQSYVY